MRDGHPLEIDDGVSQMISHTSDLAVASLLQHHLQQRVLWTLPQESKSGRPGP